MNLTRIRTDHSRDGSTVLVVMVLIALLLIYSMANLRTLDHLKGELNLLEKRQISRVATPVTNAVAEVVNRNEAEGARGPD